MPVTFLAHQAPVLPLKRRFPALDGVAMVAGSVVPDLARATPPFLRVLPMWWDGHSLSKQLTFCLPVGLLLTWVTRRLLAPNLAPYLPDLGSFHLQDLRHVVRTRHRWYVIAGSVLIGSVSHVLIDGVTHPDGWAVELVPGFAPVAVVLQFVASVGLAVVTVVLMQRIGSGREVCRWSGVDPTPPVRPRALVPVRVVAVLAVVLSPVPAVLAVTQGWVTRTLVSFLWALAALTMLAAVVRIAGLARVDRHPVGAA